MLKGQASNQTLLGPCPRSVTYQQHDLGNFLIHTKPQSVCSPVNWDPTGVALHSPRKYTGLLQTCLTSRGPPPLRRACLVASDVQR